MSISVIIILHLTSYPDDDDRDGHRNVGILRTPNAADSPRRLYEILNGWLSSPISWKVLYEGNLTSGMEMIPRSANWTKMTFRMKETIFSLRSNNGLRQARSTVERKQNSGPDWDRETELAAWWRAYTWGVPKSGKQRMNWSAETKSCTQHKDILAHCNLPSWV
jgi:hypothetical protein